MNVSADKELLQLLKVHLHTGLWSMTVHLDQWLSCSKSSSLTLDDLVPPKLISFCVLYFSKWYHHLSYFLNFLDILQMVWHPISSICKWSKNVPTSWSFLSRFNKMVDSETPINRNAFNSRLQLHREYFCFCLFHQNLRIS